MLSVLDVIVLLTCFTLITWINVLGVIILINMLLRPNGLSNPNGLHKLKDFFKSKEITDKGVNNVLHVDNANQHVEEEEDSVDVRDKFYDKLAEEVRNKRLKRNPNIPVPIYESEDDEEYMPALHTEENDVEIITPEYEVSMEERLKLRR